MGIGQRVEWLPFLDHVVYDYQDQDFANSRTLCQLSKQLAYHCYGHCDASLNLAGDVWYRLCCMSTPPMSKFSAKSMSHIGL